MPMQDKVGEAEGSAAGLDGLGVLGSGWYWEQDRQYRYTRVERPQEGTIARREHFIGLCRWEVPGIRPLTMSWEEHRALLAARLPFHDLQYVHTAEGDPRYVSVSGAPMFDPDGTFQGYRGVARDVTAHWKERVQLQDAQALLRVAAALGRFGAWSVDLRTGAAEWTEHARAIHQLPREHECEWPQVLQMYAPEYRAELAQAFQRCARDGTPYDLEVQALTAAQQRVWVRVIAVAVRDHDGAIVRVQGAYQDVHKSKVAAEEHRRLAQRLRLTLDSLTDGFGTVGRDWRISYVNPAALQIFGLARDQVVGRSLWELFPAAPGSEFGRNYKRAMEHGEERRFEACYEPLGRWFRVSAFPSEDGIAISFSDVTAAVMARQHLERVNEELEQRVRERTEQLARINEELSAFTMAVAHDLRAPLAGVSGFSRAAAERLQDHPDPKVVHYLQRVQAGVERMDDLLTGVLELSRIGRAEIELRPQDLSGLVRDALESLRAAEPQRQVLAQVEDGLVALGDARLLRTLLENLVGNAWKFTACRTPARIAVGRAADGSFYVRDNGSGFDMERVQEIFLPFRRLHAEDECKGLGIGLASARRVVERHGGRIWATSDPVAGTEFRFTLGPAGTPAK